MDSHECTNKTFASNNDDINNITNTIMKKSHRPMLSLDIKHGNRMGSLDSLTAISSLYNVAPLDLTTSNSSSRHDIISSDPAINTTYKIDEETEADVDYNLPIFSVPSLTMPSLETVKSNDTLRSSSSISGSDAYGINDNFDMDERNHHRNVSFSDMISARTFHCDSPPSHRKRQRSSLTHSFYDIVVRKSMHMKKSLNKSWSGPLYKRVKDNGSDDNLKGRKSILKPFDRLSVDCFIYPETSAEMDDSDSSISTVTHGRPPPKDELTLKRSRVRQRVKERFSQIVRRLSAIHVSHNNNNNNIGSSYHHNDSDEYSSEEYD